MIAVYAYLKRRKRTDRALQEQAEDEAGFGGEKSHWRYWRFFLQTKNRKDSTTFSILLQ